MIADDGGLARFALPLKLSEFEGARGAGARRAYGEVLREAGYGGAGIEALRREGVI